MLGENHVMMSGYLNNPKFETTQNGYSKFTARLGLPVKVKKTSGEETIQIYYNIIAWGDIAEAMESFVEGTPMRVVGKLNVRSYKSKCRGCGEEVTKYWTTVSVDNFTVVFDEGAG